MKNRFIIVYSIFASIVFIFSLSFFGYNLYNEYTTNYEKSNTKVKELVNNIRNISFSQPENNASYSQAIKTAVGDPQDYSYIQVKRNNETVVLYPSGKSREESTSKLTKSFDKDITVQDSSVTVLCNVYLIRPDSIFYYARISFLLILIITLITIIMIIYLNITENTTNVISMNENPSDEISIDENELDAEDLDASEDSEIVNEEFEEEVKTEKKSEAATNSEETSGTEAIAGTDSKETNDSQVEAVPVAETSANTETSPAETESESVPQTETESEPITVSEEQKTPSELPVDDVKPAEINDQKDTDNPSGLFDKETGIGWQSYLLTRLENEINRATASEIDLSLFVFQLKDMTKECEEFKNVCNYLALQFQFKDLLFEYNDDCIVAIKISMNVDEAITFAEKLYSDICNIINGKNCYIGITSRSIRMVTGERIMLEAVQALEHAHEDSSSPIIAFRVDSEKYRQLMEQSRQ